MQLNQNIKRKLKPAALHFVFSLLIFLIPMGLIAINWFPQPYFWHSGGWQGIRMLAVIQLILGPLLVLIISSKAKTRKAIIFDISLITIIQIAALTWGTMTIHTQRPVAIVYHNGFFQAKVEKDYEEQDLSAYQLSKFENNSPPLIYLTSPDTEEEMAASLAWGLVKGKPESSLLFLYAPVENHISKLRHENAGNIEKIKADTRMNNALARIIDQHKIDPRHITAAIFEGRYGNDWLIISDQGKLLGSIPISAVE